MSRSKYINEIASRRSNHSKWTPPDGNVKKREYRKIIKQSSTKTLKGSIFDDQTKETSYLNSESN